MPISPVEEAEELYFESRARMFSVLLWLTSLGLLQKGGARRESLLTADDAMGMTYLFICFYLRYLDLLL